MENTLTINETQTWIEKEEQFTAVKTDNSVFGEKLGLMTRLFGCWHKNISRPFSQGNVSYRSCLECGARKQFDPETLQTFGNFYFPPAAEAASFIYQDLQKSS